MVDKVNKKEKSEVLEKESSEVLEKEEQKTEEVKKEPVDLIAKSESSSAKANVGKAGKKSFKRRHVAKAKAYILCSYNNTSITMSDMNGNVLGWSTSGSLGFKGPKKATPFAATLVAQKVVEKTARFGVKDIEIYIKGVGGGREASIRALGNAGLLINSIKDITPVPHNGCRPKKPRRV